MTCNTLEDIRNQLHEDFLKQESSPFNTLSRDFMLATINMVEKLDATDQNPEVLAKAIESISRAAVTAHINLVFRLYGINTVTDIEESRLLLKYILATFKEQLDKQMLNLMTIDLEAFTQRKEATK